MARPRTYHHDDLRCPHCGSNWTPKDGHSRGKQTYRCRDCQHRFTPEGNRHYYPESVKNQAVEMYSEGSSLAATGRVLGVLPETVYSWVKKSPLGTGFEGPGSTAADGPAAATRKGDCPGRDVELCGSPAPAAAARSLGVDGGGAGARWHTLGGF